MTQQARAVKSTLTALLLLGAALRLWQYAGNASLWGDEIALAQNILERPFVELLTAPLAYTQSAPKGFLLVEKAAVALFGPSEYALRLFPLLCSLAALILFRRVAGGVMTGFAVPVAVALFTAATPLVFFAAQVKQYSTDVFAAVFLLWLALDLEGFANPSWLRVLWAAFAGAVAAWFSDAAIFVLGGLVVFFVARAARRASSNDASWRRLAVPPALWSVSALAAVADEFATMSADTRAYMQRFWSRGMLPVVPLRGVEALWPLRGLKNMFGSAGPAALAYPASLFYLALAVLGVALLWRRRRAVALFVVLPILLTIAAAAAREYPFRDRLILFLTPGLLLAVAESIEWARRRTAQISFLGSVAALIALTGPALYRTAASAPVYRVQDVKPALAHLQAKRQPGDAVYVYYRGGPSVTFYAGRYGLMPGDYVSGGCYPVDARRTLEEVDEYRGRARFWLVAADISPIRSPTEDIVDYLDAIGTRLDALVVPAHTPSRWDTASSGVYLYDLSDPARLGRSDARSARLASAWTRVGTCNEGPITVDPARRGSQRQDAP
jgi:hypothetical protein